MTDTPRTNEALAALLDRDGELSEENAPEVLVKLCRAMEREREEARADAAMWKANHDNQVSLKSMLMDRPDLGDRALRIAELIRERDDAWERADTIFVKFVDILEQTRNERDDLAAVLNRACANPTTGNWYREAQDALAAWKARCES